MKLSEAGLCLECEEIFQPGAYGCPACGNTQYLMVENMIAGEAKKIPTLQKKTAYASMLVGNEINVVIKGISKIFKLKRRYFRVNYSLGIAEECGPIGSEPCFDKNWYPCEEVIEPALFCDKCDHLSPTEKEQDDYVGKSKAHKCTRYGLALFHRGQHPRIPRPQGCGKSGLKPDGGQR